MVESMSVIKGLVSNPRYLPTWYQYDEFGSRTLEKAAYDNHFYYVYRSEWPVLKKYKKEMSDCIKHPCVYVDLGCGEMKKSRLLIDAILQKQKTLTFYPVDISDKTLNEESNKVASEYGDRLNVHPVAGDFSDGFERIRNNKNGTRNFITCLGGTLQILPYDDQVTFLTKLSDAMSDDDKFLVTMDTTNDEEAVVKAYLGGDYKSGFTEVYRNLFNRLNREFGTSFDPDNFEFEGKFNQSHKRDRPSYLTIYARSKIEQSQRINQQNMTLNLKKDELIRLSSSESISSKYTLDQIEDMAEKGGMVVDKVWPSDNRHVTCVLMSRARQGIEP